MTAAARSIRRLAPRTAAVCVLPRQPPAAAAAAVLHQRPPAAAAVASLSSWTLPTPPRRWLSSAPPSPPPTADAAPVADDTVIVVTAANFAQAVLQSPVPVILDCHADWCQPCQQLKPLLVRAVQATKGQVRLATLNVDEEPALAQQLQIRSLPTVFGLANGKLVDSFMGSLPENQIAAFVGKVLQAGGGSGPAADEERDLLEEAQDLLAQGDPVAAASLFKSIYASLLNSADGKPAAPGTGNAESTAKQAMCLCGLAQCAMLSGETDAVRELLDTLRSKFSFELTGNSSLRSTVASLELSLAAGGEGSDGTAKLEAALQSDPDDHESRLQLAQLLFQAGDTEAAIEHGLEIVKRDNSWNDQAGKELLLKFFDSLGAADELTKHGRRRLTNLLFV